MLQTELIAPVPELLRRQANERGAKIAYRDARSQVTYAELFDRTANIAGHLADNGVERGDTVAIMLPNSVQWVEACLGITRAGALGVPISYDSSEPEIAYRLSDATCKAVFTTAERADLFVKLQEDAPHLKTLIVTDSGSTSAKALRYTDLIGKTARSAPRDPPLMHSYALNLSVLSILATGASEYIMERFSTGEAVRLLKTGEFTYFPGVPTMFHYLLQATKNEENHKFPGLRLCASAGAIMPATLNREFEAQFGVPLLDGYGITETSTMVTMNWPHGGRTLGSCGLPLPGLAVRIVDPASGQDVAAGQEGELIVRGPNVMPGYHNKPEETRAALRGGWYHTGDLARCDENGFLTITGRLKELIIRGGQNIAPAEIEEVVNTFAPVLDCAVVGVAHEHLGEVPALFVVPRQGQHVEIEAVLQHCKARLSAYKIPQAVHLIAEIPRTGSGKIIRYKLKEMLKA